MEKTILKNRSLIHRNPYPALIHVNHRYKKHAISGGENIVCTEENTNGISAAIQLHRPGGLLGAELNRTPQPKKRRKKKRQRRKSRGRKDSHRNRGDSWFASLELEGMIAQEPGEMLEQHMAPEYRSGGDEEIFGRTIISMRAHLNRLCMRR